MRKLQIGIIGLGVGKHHFRAFNSHPQCEVTAVCDFSESALLQFSPGNRDLMRTGDADDILDNPAIDVVSVASFDNYHFEQVSKAIRNGKHVFAEKPLCLFPDEAIEIRRLLQENESVQLSANLNLRTCPRFINLQKEIRSGQMGDVYYLEADYLWGRKQKLTEGWRGQLAYYSIVLGAAVHMIDLLLWMTGMQPVEVQGVGNRIATAGTGFRFNDFAALLLKFDNNVVAKVTANGGTVHPHFHRLSVFGSRQTFIHDTQGASWIEKAATGFSTRPDNHPYPAPDEKDRLITSFVDTILEPTAPASIVTADDVLATMSVCFAAEKSIECQNPVPVTYI